MPLLQVGVAYASELSGIGHTACTLDGTNYESKGSRGCIKGKAARGATNSLFRHRFYLVLTDEQVKHAKAYADGCIGEPYDWGDVPSSRHGGDCSGFVSGIICAAQGISIHRLFGTGNWPDRYRALGFHAGLTPPTPPTTSAPAFPGRVLVDRGAGMPRMRGNDVLRWQTQMVKRGWSLGRDGVYGPDSARACLQFQRDSSRHGWPLAADSVVGSATWRATWARPVT